MYIKLFTTLLVMLSSLPVIAMSNEPAISFSQAWVQEGPPNAGVLAGFMQIRNNSRHDIVFSAAKSDAFRKVEFHRTVQDKGMARMQRQAQMRVSANSQLKLEHGGYHLMLIGPVKRLRAGDRVTIEFTLQNNTTMSVDMEVQKPDQEDGHAHHHHH